MANVGALREAVRTSNISLVKRLVKGGVCVDERLWYGRTLLQECVTLNDVDMVQSLIEYGEADVNAQNDDGKTALHIASRAGSFNIVSLLLEAGARTDTQCLDGTTSLHLAMWKNKSQVVEKLIKAGADPNLQDQDHWTPLHWGVQSRNLDLVKLLVENGANMDIVNKSLLTPFTLSLEICCFPIAKYMLFMGAGGRIINDTKKIPKSVISLLLRPEVVTREEVDVPKFVMLLVENGYNLWRDTGLLSGKVMANSECEKVRQLLLSQISNPPELLNLCRNRVRDLLHRKRTKGNSLERICSLQIPTHLQSYLLTRAELRLQQLARNSSHLANRSHVDLSSVSDLKKTGIIRLKKTSSLIPVGKAMTRLEQNHPSTSKCNNPTNTPSKKMVPTRIVFNDPSTSITSNHTDKPTKKMVPTRIVFNHTEIATKQTIPTRVVFNSPSTSKCNNHTDTPSKKKMVPTKIVFNHPSTTTCNNHTDTSFKKMIPTRIVFNSPHQTVGDTSAIECHGEKSFSLPQMNSNQNVSRIREVSSLNNIQINKCTKKSVEPETLGNVLSTVSDSKAPAGNRVRKLCRLNFDMTQVDSDSSSFEINAKKRRTWKNEEPVS